MQKVPVFVISGKSVSQASGGYAAYGHNLAKALVQLGHRVHVVGFANEDKKLVTPVGTEHLVSSQLVKLLPFLKSTELAALPIFSFLFINKINEVVREENYRQYIIWGVGPWSLAGVWLKITQPKKVRFLADYFATFKRETWGAYITTKVADYGLFLKIQYFLVLNVLVRFYSLLEQLIFSNADVIITHYKHAEEVFKNQFRFDYQKIKRISYFAEVFRRQGKNQLPKNLTNIYKNNQIVVLVCRQDPKKGVNYLLHAFKIVLAKIDNVKLVIVGTGTALNKNRKLAQKLGIDKHVIFTGFVANLEPILKRADISVYPAGPEGSGSLSILEAMKNAVPVVATKTDGIPEDITHGKSGILVKMHDEQALAHGLTRLLTNPSSAKKIGKNAQQAYQKKYSLTKMKKDVKKIIHGLDTKVPSQTQGLGDVAYSLAHESVLDKKNRQRVARQLVSIFQDFTKNDYDKRKILDLGCASGIITAAFDKFASELYGIDVDRRAISLAKKEYPKIKFIVGSADQLDFKTNYFDTLICNQVYASMANPVKLFSEIFRVLAPGGFCIFTGDNVLWPIESQYKLPFLNWLPLPFKKQYLKLIGQKNYYFGNFTNYWKLRSYCQSFKISNYAPKLMKNPSKYSFQKIIKYEKIAKQVPEIVYSALSPFLPTFIFVLQKERSNQVLN